MVLLRRPIKQSQIDFLFLFLLPIYHYFFMTRRAFEQTGLVPRSIIRTFDRFRKQLLKGTESSAIQEFRVSRYQVLVSVKCLITLLIVPLLVNFLAKTFFIMPLTKYLWNTQQNEIFLNLYQENRAFSELHDFEEKLFFESLIETQSALSFSESCKEKATQEKLASTDSLENNRNKTLFPCGESKNYSIYNAKVPKQPFVSLLEPSLFPKFQQKTIELAIYYNKQSIEAITNLFGDLITFITICFLFIWMEPQIIILKSFLTESIYSFSDTTKSFLLILLTDLLVGFHSPRGWEVFIEIILRHFGLPENQTFIFLFVGTFPVLLDTAFKYWIFRYLNKISPSTVATYHNMIE